MKKLRTIIVSLPGTWQRVLQKSIESYSFMEIVEVISGSLTASQLVKQHQPNLLLIDSSIPFDDAIALVRDVKKENPKTLLIVITDTTQQRRKVTQAGADYTLSTFNFESQIDKIIHQTRETLSGLQDSTETSLNNDPGTSDYSMP